MGKDTHFFKVFSPSFFGGGAAINSNLITQTEASTGILKKIRRTKGGGRIEKETEGGERERERSMFIFYDKEMKLVLFDSIPPSCSS